jgi:hypothetical protein
LLVIFLKSIDIGVDQRLGILNLDMEFSVSLEDGSGQEDVLNN